MLKNFSLAIKLLWREWRGGEWFIVFFALLLAITATTSIHFYTDRLTRGLDLQGARILGGDLAIKSSMPIPSLWAEHAQSLQLHTAEVWSYPSVASTASQLQLVNLQAVSNNYPLLGDASMHPEPHTVWVEPRLLPLLGIKLNDSITIGAANFRVAKILTSDIDMLNTGFLIAPRVMIRLDDVPATKTVLLGSRVDYHLLIVGEKSQLQQFQQWIAPQLKPGQNLISVKNQQFALQDTLERAEDYIQLVLLVCLMISGVAIGLSVQQYLRRHYAHVALWRCLGASRQQILQIFIWQLLLISLITGVVASALGFFFQTIFADLFKTILLIPLPSTSWSPVFLGLFTSVFLVFAFSYPVINELPRTSPLYIWRNEISTSMRNNFYLIFAFVIISIFVCWSMDFSLLSLFFLNSIFFSIGFLYGLSLLLLHFCRKFLVYTEGTVRRGLSQLIQYSDSVSLQFVGFSLILIAILVLGLVRTDLIANWQQSLPKKTPNYFAFNIAPADLSSLNQMFQQQNIPVEGIYPMVRGRLTALNNKPILSAVPKEAVNINPLHRELNLSWMWQFPSDNKIVRGTHWQPQDAGKPLVSVENELGKVLNLKLGDELSFQVGDQKISAVITNFRSVDWSSFHPNFFIIFPPGFLDKFPATYIASFHLSSNQTFFLNQLVQTFPNITIIDVANLLQQMQDLVGKITLAIQYLFLFSLGASVLIFITSLQASMDERRQTYGLLRILGASKKYIRKSVIVEFGCLAIMILFSSITLAHVIVYLLERRIFMI